MSDSEPKPAPKHKREEGSMEGQAEAAGGLAHQVIFVICKIVLFCLPDEDGNMSKNNADIETEPVRTVPNRKETRDRTPQDDRPDPERRRRGERGHTPIRQRDRGEDYARAARPRDGDERHHHHQHHQGDNREAASGPRRRRRRRHHQQHRENDSDVERRERLDRFVEDQERRQRHGWR